jgi:hypothetical protein
MSSDRERDVHAVLRGARRVYDLPIEVVALDNKQAGLSAVIRRFESMSADTLDLAGLVRRDHLKRGQVHRALNSGCR